MAKTPKPGADDGRLWGYARVSTADQRLDLQIDALTRAGVAADMIYVEKVSGARAPLLGSSISFSGGRTSGYMLHRMLQSFGGRLPNSTFVLYGPASRSTDGI